jgi:hypothetical protein
MFAREVALAGGYNPERFESVWAPLMEADLADVFVAEEESGELVGFLGASYIPDLYSGVPGAQSQFWFVDTEHRKGSSSVRLFAEFEKEAASRGTQKYFVGYKSGVHEEAMKDFFLRRGYVLGENIYWKNLCP